MIRTSLFLLVLLFALPASAATEIYKCVDADGNVAFQGKPCPPVKEKVDADEPEEEEVLPVPVPVPSNRSHEEIEACKEPLRDAIDAIEAEMLRGFSAEQAEEFQTKLRTLTQEMRACG